MVRDVVPDPDPVDDIGQVVEKLPPVKIVALPYLSWRFAMSVVRSMFPQRSPTPLIVPCT